MNDYSTYYLDSFKKGLGKTIYKFNQQKTSFQEFFKRLDLETRRVKNNDGRIFFIGNGASAAFSNHMALDWSKNGKLRSYSLSDSVLLTALSNDYSYEEAFVEFMKIEKLNKDDIVTTISSSGNSLNIINVINYAKETESITVGLSGLKPNNKTQQIVDFSIYTPFKTYGMVECAHQVFLHLWLDMFMGITEWNREHTQNMNSKDFKL